MATRWTQLAAMIGMVLFLAGTSVAQVPKANYDVNKIPEYTLPDPLRCNDGTIVGDAATWTARRRPEVLALFEEHVYGRAPGKPEQLSFAVLSDDDDALGGKAIRRQVRITVGQNGKTLPIDLLLYLPREAKKPVSVFLALNFYGNHTINGDPGITLSESWMRRNSDYGVVNHRATEKSRGVCARRWAIDEILERGYGLATIYCGDIDPDVDDGFQNGVHPLFHQEGQTKPKPDEWGTIAAWAWGLSRGMDYLETDKQVDSKRVAVMGHSRLGKTALWAGAADQRFALVISNNSGCGGAALSRREFGETVHRINTSFSHWFCDNFTEYNERVGDLPVDQHMLIALAAPRPVYVASATGDEWADPRGEFLAAKGASPVYRLFGMEGMAAEEMPAAEAPVTSRIGYHLRTGNHGVTEYDWQRYMDFADKYLLVSADK